MRRVLCVLTAAIAFGACGGQVREVTTYQVGKDGRIQPGSGVVTTMTAEDEITFRQQGIATGLAYSGDCKVTTGGDDTAYGGEFVGKESGDTSTSECSYFGKGSAFTLMLSFDDAVSKYYPANRSLDNNVQFGKVRGGSNAGASYRVAVYQNNVFGGGSVHETTVGNNVQTSWSQGTPTGSSLVLCQISQATGQCL